MLHRRDKGTLAGILSRRRRFGGAGYERELFESGSLVWKSPSTSMFLVWPETNIKGTRSSTTAFASIGDSSLNVEHAELVFWRVVGHRRQGVFMKAVSPSSSMLSSNCTAMGG